jgi:uncharacterized protein (TIGR02452 family)
MSRTTVAERTLALLEAGSYRSPSGRAIDIAGWQAAALAGTRVYTPDGLRSLLATPSIGDRPRVDVIDATTQVAAQRLVRDGADDLALLNFASGRSPGGGFLVDAQAQEEDLCRCSGLYPCLRAKPAFYAENTRFGSPFYTDHAIYTPGVPFFRLAGDAELLDAPFRAAVITAPAPNTGATFARDPGQTTDFGDTLRRRWGHVLSIARDMGHRTVLLGAWGCGVFGGDPVATAEAVRPWLADGHFGGDFDLVVFAIPNNGEQGSLNFAAFRDVLASS